MYVGTYLPMYVLGSERARKCIDLQPKPGSITRPYRPGSSLSSPSPQVLPNWAGSWLGSYAPLCTYPSSSSSSASVSSSSPPPLLVPTYLLVL